MTAPPLLEVRDLTVRHAGRTTAALQQVSLAVSRGERLAVVGESGSGKSTLVRALLRLVKPVTGQALIAGTDLAVLSAAELRALRRCVQIVFQDPLASLNPVMAVADIVAEPLQVSGLRGTDCADRVERQLQAVGLGAAFLRRRPSQLSGGQAQRVALARALIADPQGLLCDEPVSALDMSLRAQVLELLDEQCRQRGLALLFVTHDLAAARLLCARTVVLQRGRVVESGETAEVFANPRHAYTRELLDARLTLDPAPERGSALR
jgi:peptide/nickel transport system ATP-binding protein